MANQTALRQGIRRFNEAASVSVVNHEFGPQAWGGGSVCQEYAEGLPPVQIDCRLPDASGAFTVNGTCFAPAKTSYCTGNGEVELRFGSPEYVGLGALVFLLLVLLETFGSPFMRNCEVSYVGILSCCHSLDMHCCTLW